MAEQFASFDLKGQVVMVTAAARGLGRSCALACAHAGADIALGLRDLKSDNGVPREIEALGRKVLPLQMDVLKLDEIRSAVAKANAHFGRIDVLVNNAGIAPENLAEDVTEPDYDATVGVNLKGTFFATQEVGRLMLARGKGRIINMSSQAGTAALKGESVYCMTKAGIDHLTRCLAAEWGPRGVTVNAVAPTFIWTDGTKPYLDIPGNLEATIRKIPLGRIGEPHEVSGVVVFLASPAASLINGESILIDGGWCAP